MKVTCSGWWPSMRRCLSRGWSSSATSSSPEPGSLHPRYPNSRIFSQLTRMRWEKKAVWRIQNDWMRIRIRICSCSWAMIISEPSRLSVTVFVQCPPRICHLYFLSREVCSLFNFLLKIWLLSAASLTPLFSCHCKSGFQFYLAKHKKK